MECGDHGVRTLKDLRQPVGAAYVDLLDLRGRTQRGCGVGSIAGEHANLAALLAYVAGFITGIVFLVVEKDSKFVRFHAMQSVMTFLGLFIINIVVSLVLGNIPFIGLMVLFISPLLLLLGLVLWIVLMLKAYQGEWFKLPVIGDMAMKQVGGI